MRWDVIVIGAGQAGLAMGYFLQKAGNSFVILDRSFAVGDSWRDRYDSLTLFTPRSYSSLPGFKMPGDEKLFPLKDEVAAYLASYAKKFSLPIQHHTEVLRMTQSKKGFRLLTNQGEYIARQVVVATGAFQKAFLPPFSSSVAESAVQLHSSHYKHPKQLQPGPAAVIGGGNSGAQIAVELAKEREVYLSVGHKLSYLPLSFAGKSIFWWLNLLGLYRADVQSRVGRWLKKQPDPIMGFQLKQAINSERIKLKPRMVSVDQHDLIFADGSRAQVPNIIWATGFQRDDHWIRIPGVLNDKGAPVHQRGITPMEGLYFLGLPWQHNRSSALIQGVGEDAEYLLSFIKK